MTIAEILIVLAIVAIVTTMTVPMFTSYRHQARIAQARGDILLLEGMIDTFYDMHKQLPQNLAQAGNTGLVDPWGNPYRYLNLTAPHNPGKARKHHKIGRINTDYDLYSAGEDGASRPPLDARESRDDIIRANNGRYVGPASDY